MKSFVSLAGHRWTVQINIQVLHEMFLKHVLQPPNEVFNAESPPHKVVLLLSLFVAIEVLQRKTDCLNKTHS